MAFYGARPIPTGTLATGNRVFAVTGTLRLRGYSFTETTGTVVAEVDLYDGETSGGQLVTKITLAANESTRDWFGPDGISLEHGIAAVWVSGSIAGCVWIQYHYDWARSDQDIALSTATVSIPGSL